MKILFPFIACIAIAITMFGQTSSSYEKYISDGLTPPRDVLPTGNEIPGTDGLSRCLTTENAASRLITHPKEREAVLKLRETASSKVSAFIDCNGNNSIVIPVAIHYDASFDCTDTQCLIDAALGNIASVNDDFSAINTDISYYNDHTAACAVGYPAESLSDGTCITFCLATQNHPASEGLIDGQPAITVGKYDWTGGVDAPAFAGYLNIFVASNTGFLGISPFPGQANGDGLQVDAQAFGGPGLACSSGSPLNNNNTYNLGRTLTHEIGHFFDLDHTFSGGCADGDMNTGSGQIGVITDTPATNAPFFGCPASPNSCGDVVASNCPSLYAQITNYMDYTDDACMVMFSQDQAAVMNGWANTLTWANDATVCGSISQNSLAACALSVAFEPIDGSSINICLDNNNSIQFTDLSVNGAVSWDWIFNVSSGDIVISSTVSSMQNPTLDVTAGTTGTLTATLEVCDANGDCLMTTQSYTINVFSGAACPTECTFTLELTDTFGDGWNNATLDILSDGSSIAGSPFGTGFVTGSSEINSIVLEENATITFFQTNGGFPTEEGFVLTDPFGNVIFDASGGNIGSGEVFSFVASCEMPTCDDGVQNGDETGIDCGGLSCVPCPVCADDQLEILNETFDACVLPAGWTVSSTDGGIGDITFNGGINAVPGGGGAGPPSEFSGCIAVIDDDENDAIGIGCITTPIIDLSLYANITLTFDWQHEAFAGGGNFLVDVWDGTAWVNVLFADDDSNANNQTINLDAFCNPDFQIRFCYDDEGGFQWGAGIDNVSICGQFSAGDIAICPADEQIVCGLEAIPGTVMIDTICTVDNFIIDIQGPIISGQENCPGTTYTYAYIVSDDCDNISSCKQVYTIDNSGPVINDCPIDQTVTCFSDIVLGTPGFTTSCTLGATIDTDGPVVNGEPNCPGTVYTFTYIVTDDCGRSDICTQNFTIGVSADPVLICPANETVLCSNEIVLGVPDVETSCGVSFNIANSAPTIDGIPNCLGSTYTFTITVTDACDRSSTCDQVFTIDNPGPIITCLDDVSVVCEDDIRTVNPEFTTSCGLGATISKTGPVVNGDPFCDGTTYTYTFTVTDACGRTASCDQVFTIDNTCKRLDFCAFPAATIVTNQYPGVTISTQDNHNRPAMIFDTGNPTGNDFDLGTPNQVYGGPGVGPGFGNDSFQCNALIISKDRHIPNETEGQLIFEFDCAVFIRTIDFIDMECGHNTVTFYDMDHHVIDQITLPQYGENSFHVEEIYQSGVYKMVVDFPCAGGAISDVKYCEDMTPGAMCGACEQSTLDFYEHGVDWHLNAMAGNYTIGYQSYDIDIADPDGIFEDSHEDLSGIEIGINPHDVNDELIITYDLSEVASFVQFDIEDLDFKDGVSKQQEQVCICGFLEGDPTPIYPSIISLDGHVNISNNCAIATADSNVSHADESVLITFTECIDQVVIKYGTGPNSPTHDPTYSKMIIGKRVGFTSETCPGDCSDCGLFGDIDEDGVCDDCDICLTGDDNMDSDGDGIPDACDSDCEGSSLEGDDDLDGVCNVDDICPGGNDNIDLDGNGVPDACEECDEYKLVFGCTNEWVMDGISGTYMVQEQEFDINIMDMDNILEDTNQEGFGLNVGIEPHDIDDVVLIKYNLSQVANNVMFDIVDLDYKDGNSKQQEAVCVYGFLDTIQTPIMPMISSLDGSVSISGNCAEGTVNSAHSGQDESIMVVFDECVDQIVIEYGTGTNAPTHNPDYSNITIGFDMGFKTEVCEHLCLPACQDSMMLVGMAMMEHFEASEMIQSNQRIMGPDVKYDAGNRIQLQPGFEIMNGALFEAFIDGCDNN